MDTESKLRKAKFHVAMSNILAGAILFKTEFEMAPSEESDWMFSTEKPNTIMANSMAIDAVDVGAAATCLEQVVMGKWFAFCPGGSKV